MPRDARWYLGSAFLLVSGAFGMAWKLGRLPEAWRHLGVPALFPSFADTRAYTSGWECTRRGVDVFVANPCDPWGRPIHPPRVSESLTFLGLGQGSTVPIALAMVGLFAISVLVVAGPISPREAVVYAAIVFSPSIMLGVERGNTDLLVFTLLTVVLVTIRSRSAGLRAISYGALLLAAAVKLYPLAAAGVFLRQGKRAAAIGAACVLGPSALYLLATFDDLRLIRENIIRETQVSYGAGVGAERLQEALGLTSGAAGPLAVVGVLLALGLAVVFALCVRRPSTDTGLQPPDQRALDGFWIGAGLYIAIFLVGHNFDYKLVSLIFTVPQLLRWGRASHPAMPYARVAIATVVATLWLSASLPIVPGMSDAWLEAQNHFAFDEVLNWLLFVYLATALLVTAPVWLRVRLPRRAPASAQRA